MAGSRKAEADELESRILAKFPAEGRARILPLLRERLLTISEVGDAEIAEIMGKLKEIWMQDHAAEALEHSRAIARNVPASVVIAYSTTIPEPSARAVVLRRAITQPNNVVLLRKGSATAADLVDAISLVFHLREVYGDTPSEDARVVVPAQTAARTAAQLSVMHKLLQELATAPVRIIPGLADAQAIKIRIGPVKPRPQ